MHVCYNLHLQFAVTSQAIVVVQDMPNNLMQLLGQK